MTEFALVLPVFVLIVLGLLAFGRFLLLDRGEPPRKRDSPMGCRRSQPVPG